MPKKKPTKTVAPKPPSAASEPPQVWSLAAPSDTLLQQMAQAAVVLELLQDRAALMQEAPDEYLHATAQRRGGMQAMLARTYHAYELLHDLLTRRSYTAKIEIQPPARWQDAPPKVQP